MPRRALPTVALALGLTVVVVSGCSSETSPSVAAASAATTASTTTTTTTAPTTTSDPIVPAASPTDAATAFVNAWRNGDQGAASMIAAPTAVQTVFGAGAPGHVEDRGCNSPPPGSPVLCVYRTDPGELQVRLQPRADGWFVDQVVLSPG
jgi:hypothetical protein